MIKDTEIDTDPGRRDPAEDRRRLLFFIVILFFMAAIELTLGWTAAGQAPGKPAMAAAAADAVPEKRRILYISNSHAKTGGHVARHMQALLDELQPGRYEVMDRASPGIFAPDMLQRVLLGLEDDPDVVILALAYISFSDRMKLALQAHSARSFFKPGVFEQLSPGFWLRNYDIGLYLETFLKQHLRIFADRNRLRDLWEQPLARTFKTGIDNRPILFLEVDENQRWKFPDGFDRNLFNWRLYASGRQGHLADLAEAIESATENNVPVLGMNLPIHWEKSVYQYNAEDYRRFRDEMADAFSGAMDYVDYQDRFPVEFTAYDALHPTWHGARLHALDTVLRLHRQGIVDDARTPAEIAQVFSAMDTAVSDDYRESLDDNYEALRSPGVKRYDIFEPDNAHKLMCYLASMPVGSTLEADHLYRLSLRLRYWQESDFTVPAVDPDAAYTAAFDGATRKEIERARQRASYFQQQLVKFQSSRLNLAPLPGFDPARRVSLSEVTTQLGMLLHLTRYRLDEGREGVAFELADGRAIARGILNKEPDPSYLRVDILGDHSFLLVQPITDTLTFTFPSWARHNKPFVKFGI